MKFGSEEYLFHDDDPPLAIVEIGVNHNANMETAKRMVREARKAGGHIVKFQAFIAEEEISRYADKARYQKDQTGHEGGQLEMAKALELSQDQLRETFRYCRDQGAPVLYTAFENRSLEFLVNDLGVKSIKVASSEITNHPFLAEIAKTRVGIILSTGGSTLEEVAAAVRVIDEAGGEETELVLLHCVSSYPAEFAEINLRAMETMRQAFDRPVGYSDHTTGIEAPIIACAMGAVAVEKHFTLSREMTGPDHKASIEPDGLAAMVRSMQAGHAAKGDGVKRPVPCELENLPLIRKSIVARRRLPNGHVITYGDLAFKRPVNGIEPFDLSKVLGRALKTDMDEDQPLQWDLLD